MPKILFRLFAKKILLAMISINFILLFILISGRFSQYLSDAANGYINAHLILQLIISKIPEILAVTIPLSFFLSVITTLGRMYVNNEICILEVTGIGQKKIFFIIIKLAVIALIFNGLLSFIVVPYSENHIEKLINNQKTNNKFDNLIFEKFQRFNNMTVYIKKEKNNNIEDIFIARKSDNKKIILITAKDFEIKNFKNSHLFIMKDGYQHELKHGKPNIQITSFQDYGINIPKNAHYNQNKLESSLSTPMLLKHNSLDTIAELQWRISLPLMLLILSAIAVPLSKIQPKQGQFKKLIPGTIIGFTYITLLLSFKDMVHDRKIEPSIGLWPVHIGFVLLCLSFSFKSLITFKIKKWKYKLDDK